jgi:DnaJ-class molecular chaperone
MSLQDILNSLRGDVAGRQRGRAPARRGRDVEHELELEFLEAVRGTSRTLSIRRGESATGQAETISVKIPPGVRSGQRIRVRGKGEQAPGQPGDLYIRVRIRPHPWFRREGNDLYVDVPIGPAESVLGARVDVPTLDGTVTMTVPPSTASGQHLRLKGQGVPDGSSGAGDLYAVIKVVPPKEVSETGRQLMEQFRQAEQPDPRAGAPWR